LAINYIAETKNMLRKFRAKKIKANCEIFIRSFTVNVSKNTLAEITVSRGDFSGTTGSIELDTTMSDYKVGQAFNCPVTLHYDKDKKEFMKKIVTVTVVVT
jgi:hypothetical protein